MGQNSDKATKVIELAVWLLQSPAAHGWYDALRGCSIKREMLAQNRSCESIIVRSQWLNIQNCTIFLLIYFAFDYLFLRLPFWRKKNGTEPNTQTFWLFIFAFECLFLSLIICFCVWFFIFAFAYSFLRLILYFCVWLFIFAFDHLFLRLLICFCVRLYVFALA